MSNVIFAPRTPPPATDEIIRLRTTAKLSQAEAARMCEVHSDNWAKWEAGTTRMPKPVFRLFKILIGVERV